MSTRKKWWTRTSDDLFMQHKSQRGAYGRVKNLREGWQPGCSTTVRVYVDEGNGRELFEIIDLSAGRES